MIESRVMLVLRIFYQKDLSMINKLFTRDLLSYTNYLYELIEDAKGTRH